MADINIKENFKENKNFIEKGSSIYGEINGYRVIITKDNEFVIPVVFHGKKVSRRIEESMKDIKVNLNRVKYFANSVSFYLDENLDNQKQIKVLEDITLVLSKNTKPLLNAVLEDKSEVKQTLNNKKTEGSNLPKSKKIFKYSLIAMVIGGLAILVLWYFTKYLRFLMYILAFTTPLILFYFNEYSSKEKLKDIVLAVTSVIVTVVGSYIAIVFSIQDELLKSGPATIGMAANVVNNSIFYSTPLNRVKILIPLITTYAMLIFGLQSVFSYKNKNSSGSFFNKNKGYNKSSKSNKSS